MTVIREYGKMELSVSLFGNNYKCSGATHFISANVVNITGVKVGRTSQAEQLPIITPMVYSLIQVAQDEN